MEKITFSGNFQNPPDNLIRWPNCGDPRGRFLSCSPPAIGSRLYCFTNLLNSPGLSGIAPPPTHFPISAVVRHIALRESTSHSDLFRRQFSCLRISRTVQYYVTRLNAAWQELCCNSKKSQRPTYKLAEDQ